MVVRKRVFAMAALAALVSALGTYVGSGTLAAQSTAGAGVTFSSEPGVAGIVAHYVVSPTAGSTHGASTSADESRTVALSPKRHGSLAGAAGGVNGKNAASQPATSSTPSPSASFIGQQGSATTCSYFGQGCNPPDMALAASPQFVLQGVNTEWEVLDTKGNVQPGWPASAQNFFGVPNATGVDGQPCDTAHQSQPFLSDPRALYDPADGRFWAAMLQVEGAQAFGVAVDCRYQSDYFLAVSQTSNPNGKWNVYDFNMETDVNGQKFAADFTQIGINSQAVYFSANNFG